VFPTPNPTELFTPNPIAHPTPPPRAGNGHIGSVTPKHPYKRLPFFRSLASAPTLAFSSARPLIDLVQLKPHNSTDFPSADIAAHRRPSLQMNSASPDHLSSSHEGGGAAAAPQPIGPALPAKGIKGIEAVLTAKDIRAKSGTDTTKLWGCFAGIAHDDIPSERNVIIAVINARPGMGTLPLCEGDDGAIISFINSQRGVFVTDYPGPGPRSNCINLQTVAQLRALGRPGAEVFTIEYLALVKHVARTAARLGRPWHEPPNDLSREINQKANVECDAFEESLAATGFSAPAGRDGRTPRSPLEPRSPPKSPDEQRAKKRNRVTPAGAAGAAAAGATVNDNTDAAEAANNDIFDAIEADSPPAGAAVETANDDIIDAVEADSPPAGAAVAPADAPTVSPACVADELGVDAERIATADRMIAAVAAAAIAEAAPVAVPAAQAFASANTHAAASAPSSHPAQPASVAFAYTAGIEDSTDANTNAKLLTAQFETAEARSAKKVALALLAANREKLAASEARRKTETSAAATAHKALQDRLDGMTAAFARVAAGAPNVISPPAPMATSLALAKEQEFLGLLDFNATTYDPNAPIRQPDAGEVANYSLIKQHATRLPDPRVLWGHSVLKVGGLTPKGNRRENAAAILTALNKMPSVLNDQSARVIACNFAMIEGIWYCFIDASMTYGGLVLFDGIALAAGGMDAVLKVVAQECAPSVQQSPKRLVAAGFPNAGRWSAMNQHERFLHVVAAKRERLQKYSKSARGRAASISTPAYI
jgi:hypothetical protein